jgi:hypothetical protein
MILDMFRMKALLACTVVLSSTIFTTAALAQSPDGQTGTGTAREMRKTTRREPSNSFETLPRIVKVGQEVIVKDETGQTTRGQIVSVSDNQLVVARRRFFRSRVEQVFAKDAVRSLAIVDSTANGVVIGVAAALGLATTVAVGCSRSDSCTNGNFGVLGTFIVSSATFVPVGLGIGYATDLARNETIYERPSRAPRVTVAPLLGRNAVGLLAHVQF